MFVIDRESGGDPHAQNPSSASGLLQLMSIHWAHRFDPTNPYKNLEYGLKLWRRSSWAPWAVL
jgi:soluble lytic murein transglycosylase-like protein